MKPFFSIRIEWNPADSEDESHRDCFFVKRSVARQHNPCPKFVVDKKKLAASLRDDTSNVVKCIGECLEDLRGEAKWHLPDLYEDIIFELSNSECLEEHVVRLAEIAVEDCEDEFLDRLQKIIDSERAKSGPEAET